MARQKSSENTDSTSSLISDLISGTEFRFIGQEGEEGKGSLSDKPKVETPLYALNDLLGGGLPLGAILEVYGPNAAGKSSLMYETLGNFQKQYQNGVAFIIDSEASTDDSRLKALGVDPMRAPRMGAPTLEDGFEQIIKILRKMTDNSAYKGFPVMILWDTIAGCPSRAQAKEGNMYAGGMAEKARILKTSLTNIFPLIEKQNVLLVLLNQVMAEIGGWRPGVTSAGGNALKHDVHMRLKIDGGKTVYDGIYAIEKYSTLSLEKSKVSPLMNDIPIIINITQGGVVDRVSSLVWWMSQINPSIFKQSAWWSIETWAYDKYRPYWDKFGLNGKFRQKDLYSIARDNPPFVQFLRLIWLDLISERYTLQKEVCKPLKSQIETQLMVDLEIDPSEFKNSTESQVLEDLSTEDLNVLTGLFNVTETPESQETISESGDLSNGSLSE